MFNARGQVIGIINMGVPSMEGLNFAIPARHPKYILEHIDAFAYDATNPDTPVVSIEGPVADSQVSTILTASRTVTLDTTTPAERALFQMSGVSAEFERTMITDRT